MDNQSELEFLKDQVKRLNGVLSYYQEVYGSKSEKIGSNTVKLIFNDYTSPLLLEYDRIISEMKSNIEYFKSKIEDEQTRLKDVVSENSKLWQQIREINLQSGDKSFQSEINRNLETQIDLLRQERDEMERLLATSQSELNQLREEVTEARMKPSAVIFADQVDAIRGQYQGSVSELEGEIATLREINRDLSAELDQFRSKSLTLEKDNYSLINKIRLESSLASENGALLSNAMARIEALDVEKRQLLAAMDEMRVATRDTDSSQSEWAGAMRALEARYKDKEQECFEALGKVSDALQAADAAVADKRAAESRENQLVGECDRLRSVIAGILDDAGARTREEVDLVRAQCDKDIERITDELGFCEQNRQELLVEIDQLKRGKYQLEQDIEALHRNDRERSIKDQSSEDLVYNRAIRAERERDDARLQTQSLEANWMKERADWQRQKDALDNKVNFLEKKLTNMQSSCDKAQSNADKFSKMLAASEESAARNRKEFYESLKKSRHEYEMLKQASQIKHQELEARLSSTEETQRHTSSEMRQFLTKQQQIGAKWREEAHNLAGQYEQRLCQMSHELDKQNKRNADLVALLHEAKQKVLEGQETIEEQMRAIEMLEKKLALVITDENRHISMDRIKGDDGDNQWQLHQFKKQQQRLIKETVARRFESSPNGNGVHGWYQ